MFSATRPVSAQRPDWLSTGAELGQRGGNLVVAQRTEAKTLNPVTALDAPSRDVIRRMHSDLVHINRVTQNTESSLAKTWKMDQQGRRFKIELRRGLKFSDGQPFDADDVVFTFQVYLDEKLHSPQRDLLVINGKPVLVRKLGQYSVEFEFAAPYAAGDRVFDSIAILPKHLLELPYKQGKLGEEWSLATAPTRIAGLGPFRLRKYTSGQSIQLERNPHYWKIDRAGTALPYLDEVTLLIVPNEDAQVLRFQNGDTDLINRVSSDNFRVLARDQTTRGYTVTDVGPSLEYNFLLLNLNDDTAGRLPGIERKQKWFRDVKFRQAVSSAIDRDAVVRLVYQGRAVPLWSQVSPGNKRWVNSSVPRRPRDLNRARGLLQSLGFRWNTDGTLVDSSGTKVEFTIITPSNNAQRSQIGTIIQQDLQELGMRVQLIPLEFRTLVDRVTSSHDYDAAIMGLGSGDTDPTAEMSVLMSSGTTHLWNLSEKQPLKPWQEEIDDLMRRQASDLDYRKRKQLYDRVQQIVAEQLPMICIVSPNVLVGAKNRIGNFRPAVLEHYTLHNVDELFWLK
jgi:peptide/nickel transport system substrate-binding protein